MAFQYLKGDYKQERGQLFTRSTSDRIRGNGFKLKDERFRLDVRKIFFMCRMVRHWHSCPEKLWVPHIWRHSSPGWMAPWAAELVGATLLIAEGGTGWVVRSLPTQAIL